MAELQQGLIRTLRQRPRHLRTIMLEVALMNQINDSIREADELAELAKGISQAVPDCKLLVNLIPYNDTLDDTGATAAISTATMECRRVRARAHHAGRR